MKMKFINRKLFKSQRAAFLFLSVLFRVIMDWYYLGYVSPIWGYMDMQTDINAGKVILSYLAVIVLSLLIDWKAETFSGTAVQVLYIIMMIPFTSIYSLNNQSTSFMVYCSISFLITEVFVQALSKISFFGYTVKLKKRCSGYLIKTVFGAVIVFLLIIITSRGLNPGVLNIFNSELIYSIRKDGIALNGFFSYFYGWAYRVIMPLLLGYCLYIKRYFAAMAVVFFQTLLYLSDPHKEIFLGAVMVFLIYLFGKNTGYGKLLLAGFTAGIGGGMAVFKLTGSKIAYYGLDIFMRIFHIPASIKFQHYRFFSETSKLYFSEGRIGRLFGIQYPYGSMSVGRVVAKNLLNSETNNNTGYLAYAYDDLGYIGIIIAGILIAFVFKLFDLCITGDNQKWITAVAVYPIVCLNDAPLLQWLLGGGGIVFLILLWIFKSYSKNRKVIKTGYIEAGKANYHNI